MECLSVVHRTIRNLLGPKSRDSCDNPDFMVAEMFGSKFIALRLPTNSLKTAPEAAYGAILDIPHTLDYQTTCDVAGHLIAPAW